MFTGVSKAKGSDQQWLKNILRAGTLSDKHAALVMRVQHSPLHRLDALDALISSIEKKSKRESIIALGKGAEREGERERERERGRERA